MISVLLNWLYILFTTLTMGYGFSKFVSKKLNFSRFGYEIKKSETYVAIGLIIATVYAQAFSLFYKVGFVANLIMICFCIGTIVLYRKEFLKDIKKSFDSISGYRKVVILLLIIFWSYFTSRGYMHYDSDLYHAQSIRWIEEYGVVRGLGNLHVRLAYNSSIFAVSALYSMKFLLGQSLHTINGFMTLLLSFSILDIVESHKRKKFELSDFARLAAIYYLILICDEIVSPASDYATMCTIFYIIIKWLSLIEKNEKSIVPYALLCVSGVYTVSLKLTAGLILILVIKPAYMLIKEKRVKEIFAYLSMGIIVILPWIIRNVIISGYLIYPYPELDIFPFSWKINPEIAVSDAAEIRTWGRALYNAALVDMPVTEWFRNWFLTALSTTEKLFIIADIVCVVIGVFIAVYVFVKKKWEYLDYLLVTAAILASYCFWQLSAPLTRYGYAYILLVIVLIGGFIIENIYVRYFSNNKIGVVSTSYRLNKHISFGSILYYGVILVIILRLALLLKYAYGFARQPYYVWQKDYGKYEAVTYEISGETFYCPTVGDRIGYDHFPSSATKKDIKLIGDEIKDGFIG